MQRSKIKKNGLVLNKLRKLAVQTIQVKENQWVFLVQLEKLEQLKQVLKGIKPVKAIVNHISIVLHYQIDGIKVSLNIALPSNLQDIYKVFEVLQVEPDIVDIHKESIEFLSKHIVAAVYGYMRKSKKPKELYQLAKELL